MFRSDVTLAGLSALICFCVAVNSINAQDAEAPAVKAKPKSTKPYDVQAEQEEEMKAAQLRIKQSRADQELRFRLDNTVWNDVELAIGDPSSKWLLMTRKTAGAEKNWKRQWFLNDRSKLPQVGTWDVRQGELLLIAPDGRIAARARMDKHEEFRGEYFDPDRKSTFGSFHLIEEKNRMLTIRPFRVIDPGAGK